MMTQLMTLALLLTSAPATPTDAKVEPRPAGDRVRSTRVEPPPVYKSSAELSLVCQRTDEGTFTVGVFVAGATDLRGYQVAVRPLVGEDSPSWTLVEAYIDDTRADFVFGAAIHFNATDSRQPGRLAGVLAEGGVDVDTPSYLGTFVYRIPDGFPDQASAELIADQTLLRNSRTEAIEPRVKSPAGDPPADDALPLDQPRNPTTSSYESARDSRVKNGASPQ